MTPTPGQDIDESKEQMELGNSSHFDEDDAKPKIEEILAAKEMEFNKQIEDVCLRNSDLN